MEIKLSKDLNWWILSSPLLSGWQAFTLSGKVAQKHTDYPNTCIVSLLREVLFLVSDLPWAPHPTPPLTSSDIYKIDSTIVIHNQKSNFFFFFSFSIVVSKRKFSKQIVCCYVNNQMTSSNIKLQCWVCHFVFEPELMSVSKPGIVPLLLSSRPDIHNSQTTKMKKYTQGKIWKRAVIGIFNNTIPPFQRQKKNTYLIFVTFSLQCISAMVSKYQK